MSSQVVLPGEIIAQEENGFMPGLGTYCIDGNIFSSSLGYIKTIDKLINIIPQKIPYKPDQGDVVIGKVLSIEKSFWKVNINNKREAVLNLVNINLPQGEQRKRSQEDSMLMKNYFEENSILSGEVLNVNQDGGVSIQTRNLKYGKLKNGLFLKIDSNSIKKMKNHFLELINNIKCILGRNGFCYVYYSSIKLSNDYFTDDQNTVKQFAKEEKLSSESLMLIVLIKNLLSYMHERKIMIEYKSLMKVFAKYCEIKNIITGGVDGLLKSLDAIEKNKKDIVNVLATKVINDIIVGINIDNLKSCLEIDESSLDKVL